MKKIKIRNQCGGLIWFIGWLFTIGFLKLSFIKAVLALIIWPYYIGKAISVFYN